MKQTHREIESTEKDADGTGSWISTSVPDIIDSRNHCFIVGFLS